MATTDDTDYEITSTADTDYELASAGDPVYLTLDQRNPAYLDSAGYDVPRQQVPPLPSSQSPKNNSGGKVTGNAGCSPCLVVAVAVAAVSLVLAVVFITLYLTGGSTDTAMETKLNLLSDRFARLEEKNKAEVDDRGQLEARLAELEKENGHLTAMINMTSPANGSNFEARLAELETETSQMKIESKESVASLEVRFTNLENETSQLNMASQESVASLEARIGETEAQTLRLSAVINATSAASVARLEARVGDNEQEVEDLKLQLAFRDGEDAGVSFMAKGLTNYQPSDKDVLVFPKVLHDQGGGYDNNTGVFTAPTAGIYAFFATLQGWNYGATAGDDSVFVYLYKDINIQLIVWTQSDRESDADSTSVQAVLDLQKGSQVYLKAGRDQNYFFGNGFYTSFSGFLVSRTQN